MKTINLEQILKQNLPTKSFNTDNWLDLFEKPVVKNWIVRAMKETIKQTLELAAENANMELSNYKGKRYSTHEFIDDHTDIVVNKQSILDTINQIK